MSSSASTVLTFPLTLREYFWVIGRASSISAAAVFVGAGHVPVESPCRCIRVARRVFRKLRLGNTARGGELLRGELALCQRLHGREQSPHVAFRNVPRDEHHAAVAILIRPGFELDRRMS